MARRSSSRIQTAEKTFVFNLNPSNTANPKVNGAIIDIAQVYSLVNRVSMRQGYEYVVQSLEIGVQAGGAFEACIMRLPEHWSCINAWEKTMRLWMEQQDETADQAGLESTRARYRDFKVHFDAAHSAAGFSSNLIPSGFATTDAAGTNESYEWFPSEVVIPNDGAVGNTTERLLHMVGPDVGSTSAGMIHAYADSRARPQQTDPNIVDVPTGGLFGEMFDVGDDDNDIITNYQDANEQPPYLLGMDGTEEYYPGGSFQGYSFGAGGAGYGSGQFVDILSVNAAQNYNSDTCPGFVAPCGLIQLSYNATGANTPGVADVGDMPFGLWLKLVLAPGSYKGVLAQSMQEAN